MLLWNDQIPVLPPDTSQPQTNDLIAAQPGEEPHDSESAHQFKWVELSAGIGRQVTGFKVQTRPQQLGPYFVRDDARVRPRQRDDAARRGERTRRIKATRDPLPLLAIMEEGAYRHDIACLCPGRKWASDAQAQWGAALGVVTDTHSLHLSDIGGAYLTCPLRGLAHIRMFLSQPAAHFEQDGSESKTNFVINASCSIADSSG